MKVSLYQEKNTPIHKLDPRTKIVASLIFFLCALVFNHPLYVFFVFSTLLFLVFLSRSFYALRKLKFLMLLLFLFSVFLWPFFVEGKSVLFYILSYPIYRESFLYAIAMGLRLLSFILIGIIYVSTTKNEETAYALILLGLPYPFSFAIATAMRLVPTFVDAAVTVMEAQISRGLEIETKNPLKILKRMLILAIPMFIATIRNTNMLGLALESRGFNPSAKRTFYIELKAKIADYVSIFILVFLLLFSLYLRIFCGLGALIPGRI